MYGLPAFGTARFHVGVQPLMQACARELHRLHNLPITAGWALWLFNIPVMLRNPFSFQVNLTKPLTFQVKNAGKSGVE